ncbi:amidohydrolase family protein [Streptomyces globisporus]|uniref:amidohydrolase family protein n=1 Tax=Streptomyces globisporus TaxID=1908 RepID=UPI00099B56D7|nr:amidohydrolase family protein [Streptomyces globisporus]
MATSEAVRALGLGDVTGRLTPGFSADLLVVEGDPLAPCYVLHVFTARTKLAEPVLREVRQSQAQRRGRGAGCGAAP